MELYWLLRLPHLHDLFNVCAFFSLLIGGTLGLMLPLFDDLHDFGKFKYVPWFLLPFGLLCAFASCMCPTKTDLAIMLGWDAINSDSVQEVIELLKEKIR